MSYNYLDIVNKAKQIYQISKNTLTRLKDCRAQLERAEDALQQSYANLQTAQMAVQSLQGVEDNNLLQYAYQDLDNAQRRYQDAQEHYNDVCKSWDSLKQTLRNCVDAFRDCIKAALLGKNALEGAIVRANDFLQGSHKFGYGQSAIQTEKENAVKMVNSFDRLIQSCYDCIQYIEASLNSGDDEGEQKVLRLKRR